MPPTADANLDELKRKARRRLVGAVVLALAAAVFVPMLLESDERPLGDDVAVRIPSVDQGKFINRINSPGGGDKAAPAKAAPAPAPVAPSAIATPPASSGDTGAAGTPSAAPSPAPATRDASIPPSATPAPASDAPATKPSATPPPKAAAEVVAKTAATPKPAAGGGFVVQLAAFADDKGANSLAARLKKSGHPAFTEPVTTSHGTLWRVRVGPYTTRDEANTARDQLKREGQNGIVAARSS
jgi:DedD protein